MSTLLAASLSKLNRWKQALAPHLNSLRSFIDGHELADIASRELVATLRQRLVDDKSLLVFVAGSSHDSSSLIDAVLFADTGRRVIPPMADQSTRCSVELRYDTSEVPALAMLPIESLHDERTVAQLRADPSAWTHLRLQGNSPSQLAGVLAKSARTKSISPSAALALGVVGNMPSDDDQTQGSQGFVDIPAWRYALVNYPHPLFESGLVVLATTGLNLLADEAWASFGLPPKAAACVFIVDVNTGVSESDLAVWRNHFATHPSSSFVVLDRIETLDEPNFTQQQLNDRIDPLRQSTAQTLEITTDRVVALSSHQALIARVENDTPGLHRSRVLELESLLAAHLLRQREVLQARISDEVQQLRAIAARHVDEQRRKLAQQVQELKELHSKSGSKVQTVSQAVDVEKNKFKQYDTRLHALRTVHRRMATEVLSELSGDRRYADITRTQTDSAASPLRFDTKKRIFSLFAQMRERLASAQARAQDIHTTLETSLQQLNAEFALALAVPPEPKLTRFTTVLTLIESNCRQDLGIKQTLHLALPNYRQAFYRRLSCKVREVFDAARSEFECWNTAALKQVDSQIRERRHNFKRRCEALERVNLATGALEQRIRDIEARDVNLQQCRPRIDKLIQTLLLQTNTAPADHESSKPDGTPGACESNKLGHERVAA